MREAERIKEMKKLGFTIPNEKDGEFQGTIEKANHTSIGEDNAKLQQICEPPGVWNEYDIIKN